MQEVSLIVLVLNASADNALDQCDAVLQVRGRVLWCHVSWGLGGWVLYKDLGFASTLGVARQGC